MRSGSRIARYVTDIDGLAPDRPYYKGELPTMLGGS
jgi:hypothetical protein